MTSDTVVYLAHRTNKADTEWREDLACKGCRNKTFAVAYDLPADQGGFPIMRCACCGSLLGRIGWAPEDQ
jgi:hypothetical protein